MLVCTICKLPDLPGLHLHSGPGKTYYSVPSLYEKGRTRFDETSQSIQRSQRLEGLENIQLVVWDFDCTITKQHTVSQQLSADLDLLMGDTDLFRQTIYGLLANGKKVAIASYGHKATILSLMNRVFPNNNPFTESNVITPVDVANAYNVPWREGHEPPFNFNKNYMLQLLADKSQLSPSQVLLIDDSFKNVMLAKSAGYRTVLIRGCGYSRQLYPELGAIVNENNENFLVMWNNFLFNNSN